MTAALSVEVLDLDGVARFEDRWRDLAARCLEPTVFNEPEFALAAARHFGGRGGPRFVAVSAGRGLVGLCPVRAPRGPGPAAAVWTHPQATAAYPLLDRETAEAALAAILTGVRPMPWRPAALLLSGVPRAGPTAALLERAGSVHRAEVRSRAVLPRGAAIGLSPKARKEARRQWNRLAERGPAIVAAASSPAEVAAALDRFFALEAKGWKGRCGTALGSSPATRAFATAALLGLAGRGQCRIDSLLLAGRPIAMAVVLRSADRAFFWKIAYDEEFARFSPGLQLTLHLTEALRGRPDIALTDSCAVPGHSMIDRVWPDRIEVADYLVATDEARPTAYRWACMIDAQARRLRATVKGLVHRVRGG